MSHLEAIKYVNASSFLKVTEPKVLLCLDEWVSSLNSNLDGSIPKDQDIFVDFVILKYTLSVFKDLLSHQVGDLPDNIIAKVA